MENKNPKIIILSGKARAGKDTTMNFLNEIYSNIIQLQYGSYIKEYAKKISNWDGSEETKPRELLQQLGTNIIRENIDNKFFVKKMIDDIKVYSYFFDTIVISDARFKIEIDDIKNTFNNVIAVRIERPNFDNGLTLEQKKHPSEIDLDDYNKFNYKLINDGTLEDLKKKVEKLVEVIENES
mgnify:FL=1